MNPLAEIRKSRAWFVDTTLRDGEQAAGVGFSDADRVELARQLAAIGVRELEVGIPASGETARRQISEVAGAVPDLWLLAWCRARPDDLDAAAQCPVQGVHLSFPVSNIHLQAWRKNHAWVLRTLRDLTEDAAGRFDYVTVGTQDASRADRCFLADFCHAVAESPAIRLRLADTVGVLNPKLTEVMTRNVLKNLGGKLVEIHAHNDLGMATANTIVAWQNGAKCLSTTVNGLGERAGNACFAEVATALSVACHCDSGIELAGLGALSSFTAKATQRVLPAQAPVVGEAVFSHASGIHLTGLRRDRRTYEAFAPESVGHLPSRLYFGAQSGPGALREFAGGSGILLDPATLAETAERLREFCRRRHTVLSPNEAALMAADGLFTT
ncbi:homocitrate synthase/isopropylmalate synthase family protein [Haloferula sargassicola]|uniref:2-phosphonomethylmalate synthase n=1 Tax=Haloferula sargassicola TaxID=490096 RepID=A0ABP9UP81_9BACT